MRIMLRSGLKSRNKVSRNYNKLYTTDTTVTSSIKDMKDLNHSFHFIEGEAEDVILDTVSREEIDLVVMGTVARTDLVGLLVGNTSEAVLNQINSSVLATKPPGFISPVTQEDR